MLIWALMLGLILLIKVIMGELDSVKKKKRFLVLSGAVIVLIVGSRYADTVTIGDINNYYRLYTQMPNTDFEDLFSSSSMEPGYLLFNKVLSIINPWPQMIIYAEAIVCVAFSFRFIYKFCPNVFLGAIGFLSQGLFVFELTAFRQGIAISLCLFAVEFIEKKKAIRFFITVLVAFSFHHTAIIFFPFYFISKLRPTFVNALLYAGGSLLFFTYAPALMSLGSDITGSDYNNALVKGTLTGPLINITIYVITLVLLAFISQSKKAELDFSLKWKWNMTIWGLMVYLLRFVSVPFERISFYFSGSTMVLLPFGIEKAYNERDRVSLNTLYIILSIVLYYVRFNGIEYQFFIKEVI